MKEIGSLTEIQKIEVDILDYIVKICKEYNLRYFLVGGTLLGAIRHQGFIPWDDDIDISMPRKDYEKLIHIFSNIKGRYKLLQINNNTNYFYSFIKIVDTKTKLIECNRKTYIKDLGIYVDIFPLDGLGNDRNKAIKKVLKISKIGRRVARSAENLSNQLRVNKIKILTLKCLVNVVGREKYFQIINNHLKKCDFDDSKFIGCVYGMYGESEVIERKHYASTIDVEFEGKKYKAPIGYDCYLKQLYGDYMKLPPEEERVPKHNIKVYWREEN